MRINIMGSAPGWQDVPENNGFIWGVNNTHLLRKVDRIIDVHVSRLNIKETKDKYHLEQLKEKDIEAYLHSEISDMPNVKRYPIEAVMEYFDTDYFACGLDYMIALAIYEGATEIHIYGVWLAGGTEYAHQKASMEYWIGIVKGMQLAGRDIKIEVHGDRTALLKTHNGLMYGYQTSQKWVKGQHPNHKTLQELIEMYDDPIKEEESKDETETTHDNICNKITK